MKTIKIGKRVISSSSKPYFIADIGANHDGDLSRALKLIEIAKENGADAAKFQNFKASKIVSKKGFETIGSQLSHQKKWKKPVYEIYEEASIAEEWTQKLKEKCDEVGIEYFTSPYDFNSVDLVDKYVNVYKIGSGDITWLEIIEYIAKKGKPVMLATGASSLNDVDRAVRTLENFTDDIVLMQCNTNYTGDYNNFHYINLNVLKSYKERYPNLILGLSDHTPGHSAVLGAIALGARVFEKHLTDDNSRSGPDHKFAMNPKTWNEMVEAGSELYISLGDGIKKVEENESETALVQRRALRYTCKLTAGSKINANEVFPLRPYNRSGFHPYEINEVIGKTLSNDVDIDQLVKREDFYND